MDLFTELENAHDPSASAMSAQEYRAEECHREWQRARDCEKTDFDVLGILEDNTKMTPRQQGPEAT